MVKDRQTGNNRGLAYVRFGRAYDAAMALENCDPSEPFHLLVITTVILVKTNSNSNNCHLSRPHQTTRWRQLTAMAFSFRHLAIDGIVFNL